VTINKIVPAIAMPASASVPRWPTIAVSTRMYSGSIASVPSAGIAKETIRRSSALSFTGRSWHTPENRTAD